LFYAYPYSLLSQGKLRTQSHPSFDAHVPFPPSPFLKRTPTPGKVHGSLARAGKVRGQTPKVAKQEKPHGKVKQDLRGRAKKRMQYNKRYVNATVGMGGKKVGPNSQAERMAKAEAAKAAAGQGVKA